MSRCEPNPVDTLVKPLLEVGDERTRSGIAARLRPTDMHARQVYRHPRQASKRQ
jgi:hypothetical protein